MGGIGYETNKNKSQDLEFEEKERVKTLEACGEIETFVGKNKIDCIKSIFKKGTIKGSLIKDELYLVNDKYGFYSNGWEWQFCEYTPVEVEIDSYWGEHRTETQYETKHLKELEFEDIYNLLNEENKKQVDKIIEEKEEEFYKNSWNRIYYELEANTKYNDMRFYLEYKNTCFEIRIDKRGYIEIFADDLECYADKYNYFKEEVEKRIDEKIIKYIDKGITKLENGFVYKNNYYETFEEVKDVITEEEKPKEEEPNGN